MNFQKLWNCGSLFGIHTSAVLVNQWPPNTIFCLLLDGNREIYITFLIFLRTWCLTTAVFCFEQKTDNISVVSSHFHLYLRISALRLPTVELQSHSSLSDRSDDFRIKWIRCIMCSLLHLSLLISRPNITWHCIQYASNLQYKMHLDAKEINWKYK